MNIIQNSMKDIQASEELKKKTLQYLEAQRKSRNSLGAHYVMRYMIAAVCVFLLLGAGGYSAYARPVSYISIDLNPSIELGINRFDRVVSVNAYSEDGKDILAQIPLKNIPYLQAINRLLENDSYSNFLTENSLLVVTVISEHSDMMVEEIEANELLRMYGALIYTSDLACMEEAHRHEMSFGKYGAYLELSQYDESITVEECYGMTMREIHNRIESCQSHEWTEEDDGEEPEVEGIHHEESGVEGIHHEEPGMEGDYEGAGIEGSDYKEPGMEGNHHEEAGDTHGEHHK